jgi:hypothetical protein
MKRSPNRKRESERLCKQKKRNVSCSGMQIYSFEIFKTKMDGFLSEKKITLKYSLGVKRDEMRKLEEIASNEEKRIEMAEKYLEEDAALFDEFLKENGNNSTQAVKM